MKKQFTFLTLLLALLIGGGTLRAQMIGGYTFSTGTDASKWIQLTTTTDLITETGDSKASTLQNIGFSFPFGEEVYTQFSVNSDGNLRLGSTVTGTTNYASPFNAINANKNNPKINGMGCDGYHTDSCHVYAENTVDANGNSLLVVEFYASTYSTSSRASLLKWQVHLYPNGNLSIVYHNTTPPILPATYRQVGLCADATDGQTISATHTATAFTAGTTDTIARRTWPDTNRYYSFTRPTVTCPRPAGLMATAVTDEGFTVSWTEMGSATQWLVRLTDSTTTTQVTVSDTFYTVTGLVSNAGFDVSVASLCGVGDTSNWRSISNVRTANCVRVSSLPYNYGFEDATGSGSSHSINSCWTKATTYTSTAYPHPSGTKKRTGDYALYFYSTSSYYSYAVTPMFDAPINTLQANFYLLKNSANYGHLKVGVIENPNDLSTFTALADLQPSEVNEWEYFEVPLTGYTGTGRFIAFVCDQAALNNTYLDDITIDYLPACPRPANIVYADTTSTSISLSWTESGSATSWLLEYGPAGFEPGQGTFEEVSNNNGYTLSNLAAGTVYDIYIRALCSDGDTSTMLKGSFATLCGELELPVVFDFESAETGTTAPFVYCWNRINDASGSATYYPYVTSTTAANAHSGTNALYFYQSTTASQAEHQYAVLPPVNTSSYPMNENEIVFWAKMSSTSTGELIVGVMTDPTADSTFVAVDTVEIATGGYNVYTVSFANYTGDGQYIALLGRRLADRSPYTYVDDIEVRVASTCPTVENPVTVGTTHNEATLSWDSHVLQSTYNVYYGEAGFNTDNVTPETVADTFITLTNLQPNTEYEYYLVAGCSDGADANATARYTFRTACSPILGDSLPYTEDFEAYTSGSSNPISTCWTKGTNNSTNYPYAYQSSTNSINGNNVLYFYSNTTSYSYAALPLFENELNTLRMRFNVKRDDGASYKSIIEVGVMSNPNDINTFDSLDTYDLSNEVVNTIRAIEVLFDQYTGEGLYIAFRAPKTVSGTNYIYIDDVVVDPIPSCRRAVDLVSANITTDGATLSWTNNSASVSSYTVAVSSNAAFDPDTCTNTYSSNTNSYPLTGLNSYSRYYWAVQANCGSDGESDWSDIATFQTAFDCGPDKTNIIGVIGEGTSSIANSAFNSSTSYPSAFTSSLYTAEELNELGIQTNNSIHSILIRCASNGDTIPGAAVYITETDLTEFSGAADTIARDSMTLVYSGALVATDGEWMEIVFDSAFAYSGTRNLLITMARTGGTCPRATSFYYTSTAPDYLAVYSYNTTSGSHYCYRTYNRVNMKFNICTEIPECSRPEDVAAAVVLSDSAFFTWTGTASQYEVAYGTPGFNPDTTDATLAGTHVTVTGNSYALNGLTPSTDYQLYVRSFCGNEVSPWSMPVTFHTACTPTTLPYSEDFESYGSGSSQSIDACWTKNTNSNTNYPYPFSTNAISGERSLYFYSTHPSSATTTAYYSYAALPLFDAPLDTLTLSFKMRRYNSTTATYTSLLHVGVMTDPTDINTFTAIDTIDLYGEEPLSIHGIEVSFDRYQGTGRYIAIYAPVTPSYGSTSTINNYVYVDDVKVDYTSNCPSPINITIDTTTETTAVVRWTDRASNPAGYELQYGPTGFELGSGTIASCTTNPATLTGLTPGCSYDVYVRTLCSATEGGPWSIAFASFNTLCAPISTLPVTYDFENAASGSSKPLPLCWNRINDATSTTNYYPYIYTSSSYAHSGTKLLYFFTSTSSTHANNQLAALPEIDTALYPINTLEIVFWGRGNSATSDNNIIVGIMTDPTNLSTFTAVDTLTLTTTVSEYTVALNNYNGYGSYPAFKKVKGSAYGYAYIDDITIDVMSVCGRPDSLIALSATSNSATLGWRDTIGATSWSIEYGEIGGTMTTVIATGNPFTLTGLTPASNYTFRVASYCANGELGGYSRTGCNFVTTQVPATLPYSYNFEDATEWSNWQTSSNRSINWYRGTAVAGEGNYSMYISADSGATRSTNMNQVVNACAYRDIDFGTTPSSFVVSYQAHVGGDTTGVYDGVSVMLVDPATYVESSNTGLTTPWGHINDLSLGITRRTNGWINDTVYYDNISGVKRMVFYWFNQSTGYEEFVGDPAAIDNIVVAEQACQRPYDLSVDTLTSTTATLSWGGDATGNYELVYRVYGTSASTNVSVNVSGTSTTLSGLNSQTEYVFWVRRLCSSTLMSDFSNSLRFTTECGLYIAADTFYEDFHTIEGPAVSSAGVLPNCWEGYTNGTSDTYLPHVVSTGSFWFTASDSSSLMMLASSSANYGNTKIARLPMFAEPVNTLTLSYWMCTESASAGTLSVGYLTGENYETDFVSLKDIPASDATVHSGSGHQPTHGIYDTITFDSVPAEAMYIAFKWYQNGSTWFSVAIDNVKVYSDVSCPMPTITAVTHDYATATLTWSGNATNYEVNVKAQADANWPAEVAVNNATTYTFTGLTPATTYLYRLRALCEEGETSTWVEGTFTTDSLPCYVPTNLTATPAKGTAEMSWTNGGEETAWNIHVWNTAFDQTFTATASPFSVTGLTQGTEYYAAIQSVCGGGVVTSEFSDTITFTTDVCDPVTNVTATVSGTTATVTWTAGEDNTGSFLVEYGIAGFASGTGTTVNATSTSVKITGLESETSYEVYVRAVCDGQYNSAWSDPATFQTEIGINTVNGNNQVSIYPNPAEQSTTISVSGVEGDVTVTIVDMNGRTVSTYTMVCNGDCEKMMNVENLAAGSYFVRLQGNGLNTVKKLVIK